MTIQRAVLKGMISGVVATRTIFTADVVVIPGDEAEDYWAPYIHSVMDEVVHFTCNIWSANEVETSQYVGGSWVPFDTFSISSSGMVSGESLPNAVATVLLGKAAGLRHVGRKFFSAIAESATSGNTLTGDAVASAAAALLGYITPLTTILGTELTPGVVDAAGTFHPFVGGVVSSLLGSMRRRKPGLGI